MQDIEVENKPAIIEDVTEVVLYGTPQQRLIVECTARYIGLFAGRRWGKSVGCSRNRIIKKCLETPGIEYAYITPKYAQCYGEYEALLYSDIAPLIKRKKVFPFPCIWFTNGSYVSYRSYDNPESLKGKGFDEVWVDEIQDSTFQNEDGFLRVIRPLLSDKRGTLIVSGQFAGKDWRYERYFLKGQKYLLDDKGNATTQPNPKFNANYFSVRFPTSDGLLFQSDVGKADLEECKELPQAVWESQYLCLPTMDINSLFPSDQIDAITQLKTSLGINVLAEPIGKRGNPYIIGYDLGSHGKDYSVIIVLDCITGIVVHCERIPLGTPHAIQARRLAAVQVAYNNPTVLLDSTGGGTGGKHAPDAFLKFYRDNTVKNLREIVLSNRQKDQMVKTLGLHIQQKSLWIPSQYKELIAELRNYTFEHISGGMYRYTAPKGQHDDYVSALLLAVWGRENRLFSSQQNNGTISLF